MKHCLSCLIYFLNRDFTVRAECFILDTRSSYLIASDWFINKTNEGRIKEDSFPHKSFSAPLNGSTSARSSKSTIFEFQIVTFREPSLFTLVLG